MDNNTTADKPQDIATEGITATSANTDTQPTEPSAHGSSPTINTTPQTTFSPSHRSKKPFVIFCILLALIIGASVYMVFSKSRPAQVLPKTAISGKKTLASAKPQFTAEHSTAGYLTYNASKFKELPTIHFPSIHMSDPNVNVVITQANVTGWGDAGLFLYDLSVNKTYKLTSGGGDPRIMGDHFVVYGFDEGKGASQKVGARLLDLQTGENKIIYSASPNELSGTACCSVSPDGFRLVMAQKGKLVIWDIRTESFRDYPVDLNPVADGASSTTLGVETDYAKPVWTDSNTILFADKPATKIVREGSVENRPPVDTNVFQLNLSDGTTSERPTNKSGIYDIYTRQSGSLLFTNEVSTSGGSVQFTVQSFDHQPVALAYGDNWHSLSPGGDKLYDFPTLYIGPDAYNVIDTTTKATGAFHPTPKGIASISQIIPKGWAGEDRMILQILDAHGVSNHEYIAIYNTKTDTVEQYATVK